MLCMVDVLVYHVSARPGARGRTPSTKVIRPFDRLRANGTQLRMYTG
jgi:hypothetical protein